MKIIIIGLLLTRVCYYYYNLILLYTVCAMCLYSQISKQDVLTVNYDVLISFVDILLLFIDLK